MHDLPETNDSLLARIVDSENRDAWYQFVSIYRPLIYRIARRQGLQDADAQNLIQDVLAKVEREIGKLESGKATGKFRYWLSSRRSQCGH